MTAHLILATVHEGLASLEEGSVDLVLSSPPFLALRSYLPATHPTKSREIGSEATPADFLDTLLDVVEACDRVLAPHGSLVFELGDTYAGSGGAGGDYDAGGLRDGQPKFRQMNPSQAWRLNDDGSVKHGTDQRLGEAKNGSQRVAATHGGGWPLDKSLTGIPALFAWSLAYGRNLLRPERETEPWRIRNVVAWCRPNPPVGALADKCRPATSYLTVATKSRTRWFDMDAVRTQALLDWWEIPTEPYSGSHYATWPRELVRRCVLLMCPQRVCTSCGEPSRRIVERTNATGVGHRTLDDPQRHAKNGSSTDAPDFSERVTLGWSDCGHDAWRNGVTLDPFAGSGTTLAVAQGHGRDSIGIDLDARNTDLARERVGMFLTVEHLAAIEREEVEA